MRTTTPSQSPELMEFIYHIAHDLNAPIRQMREMSRLLVSHLAERTDDEDRKFLQHIISSGDKSEQMLAALTEFYRLGNASVHLDLVQPHQVLAGVRLRLQNELEGCSLVIDEDTLPQALTADPQLLTLALQHLLDNAAKFHLLGATPQIWVHAENTPQGWLFSVEDNGIGVPEAHRAEIFSLFRRLHPESAYRGVGAGLALAQKITQMHSGAISCDTSILGGAKFTICLPSPPKLSPASH